MIVILLIIILFLFFGEKLGEAAEVGVQLVNFLLSSFAAVAFHHPAHGDGDGDEHHGQGETHGAFFQHEIYRSGTQNEHVGGDFVETYGGLVTHNIFRFEGAKVHIFFQLEIFF